MNRAITSSVIEPSSQLNWLQKWLSTVMKIWVALILSGQWIFALYILNQFTLPLVTGQIDESRYAHMITGYVNGETFNNLILLLHVIPIMLISLSGTLQLVPAIRTTYPVFHRLNGRFYLAVGLLGALSGLYLTWVTGSRLSNTGALGVTLNGLLIPIFIYFTWQTALKRQFALHRRYAVHAFILINGVWTFRLLLMGWLMVNQGRMGNSSTLDGPADITLSFASYLLPMFIAELYFYAVKHPSKWRAGLATIMVMLAVVITAIGIVAATLMLWGPRIIGS